MTLMDAPKFDVRRERRNRNLGIAGVVLFIVAFFGTIFWRLDIPWQIWHWPSDRRVNTFFAAVESDDLQKAYGIWNNDANWQQHAAKYAAYDFNQFQKDWGTAGDYGAIKSRKIIVAKSIGNGVVIGVAINNNTKPLFYVWITKPKPSDFTLRPLFAGLSRGGCQQKQLRTSR